MIRRNDIPLIAVNIFTSGPGGKGFGKTKPMFADEFLKYVKRIEKLNGKKVSFNIEANYEDQRVIKELLGNGMDVVRQLLKASHVDIYRASPVGEPFDMRKTQAFAKFRDILRKQYMQAPVKGRRTRMDAVASMGATRSANPLWHEIWYAMKDIG